MRTGVGCLIGTLLATVPQASRGATGPTSDMPISGSGGSCTNIGMTGLDESVSTSNAVRAVQSQISYHPSTIGVYCNANFYWSGMESYVSNGCGSNPANGTPGGPFAQTGWGAQLNSDLSVSYFTFTEYYDTYNNPGCGSHVLYWPAPTSDTTFKVKVTPAPAGSCSSGGQLAFYSGSSLTTTACTDWQGANLVQAVAERQGAGNSMGNMSYLWTEYCSVSSGTCDPNTSPGGSPNLTDTSQTYIGYVGVPSPSWPNWTACDKYEYTSSTC